MVTVEGGNLAVAVRLFWPLDISPNNLTEANGEASTDFVILGRYDVVCDKDGRSLCRRGSEMEVLSESRPPDGPMGDADCALQPNALTVTFCVVDCCDTKNYERFLNSRSTRSSQFDNGAHTLQYIGTLSTTHNPSSGIGSTHSVPSTNRDASDSLSACTSIEVIFNEMPTTSSPVEAHPTIRRCDFATQPRHANAPPLEPFCINIRALLLLGNSIPLRQTKTFVVLFHPPRPHLYPPFSVERFDFVDLLFRTRSDPPIDSSGGATASSATAPFDSLSHILPLVNATTCLRNISKFTKCYSSAIPSLSDVSQSNFVSTCVFQRIFSLATGAVKKSLTFCVGLLLALSVIVSYSADTLLNFNSAESWFTRIARTEILSSISQLHYRLRSCHQWPFLISKIKRLREEQNSALRNCRIDAAKSRLRATKYIFMSSVALVLVDISAGIVCFLVLRHNSKHILGVIRRGHVRLHGSFFMSNVGWLMNFPAGLKPNWQFTQFMGSIIIATVEIWHRLMSFIDPLEPILLDCVSFTALGGIAVCTAIVCDIVTVFTLHIFYIYVVFARMLLATLRALKSLFQLFRGLKLNTLKRRIDTSRHDMAHTVVGTLLFTLLVFLLPTVVAFYGCFLFLWLQALGIQCVLLAGIALLNHFPLFFIFERFFSTFDTPRAVAFRVLPPYHEVPTRRSSANKPCVSSTRLHSHKDSGRQYSTRATEVRMQGVAGCDHAETQRTTMSRSVHQSQQNDETTTHLLMETNNDFSSETKFVKCFFLSLLQMFSNLNPKICLWGMLSGRVILIRRRLVPGLRSWVQKHAMDTTQQYPADYSPPVDSASHSAASSTMTKRDSPLFASASDTERAMFVVPFTNLFHVTVIDAIQHCFQWDHVVFDHRTA